MNNVTRARKCPTCGHKLSWRYDVWFHTETGSMDHLATDVAVGTRATCRTCGRAIVVATGIGKPRWFHEGAGRKCVPVPYAYPQSALGGDVK